MKSQSIITGLLKEERRIYNPSSEAWQPKGIGCATLPGLPLYLNGVSVHCWNCYNVRILSRGETIPTCENGENNPTGEETQEKELDKVFAFTPTLLFFSV